MQNDFPNAKNVCYLNTAAQGLLPLSSLKALTEAARLQTTPQLVTDDEFHHLPARCRKLIADMLHCSDQEIALTTSTGYGLAAIAHSLPLSAGDEVLLMDRDFPSNTFAWEALRNRGILIRKIPFLPDSNQMSRIFESIRPETRVLCLSSVHFYTGYRVDLEAAARFCKDRNILLVVDAVQSVGCLEWDLGNMEIAAISAAGHKWQMAPDGTGFLYIRKELMPRLHPAFSGWISNNSSQGSTETEYFDFRPSSEARRFEIGTTPWIQLAAYENSLKLLQAAKIPLIEKHNLALALKARQSFENLGWTVCESPLPSAIVSAKPKTEIAMPELHAALREKKVYVSLRDGHLRIAPHFYNSGHDIDHFFTVLRTLLGD